MKIRKEIRANKRKEEKKNWKKIGVKNKQRKSGKQIHEKMKIRKKIKFMKNEDQERK